MIPIKLNKHPFYRKLLIAIIATTLIFSTTTFSITAINKTETQEHTIPDSLSYSFSFNKPTATLKERSGTYTQLNIPGCINLGKSAGDPLLPQKFIKIVLPPQKTIESYEIIGIPHEITISNIDIKETPIIPTQPSVPFGEQPGEFIINNALYSSNQLYPSSITEDYQIGYSRGYTIASFALSPTQYNPQQGIIYYYPELTINIELEQTNELNQFYRDNLDDKLWVQSLVLNPEVTEYYSHNPKPLDYPGGLCDPGQNYDYVIITTEHNNLDEWTTGGSTPYNWDSLMTKHQLDQGLKCTLTTIQDIDDCNDYQNSNPLFDDIEAHIREFAKDAYQDWGASYILIGGDDEWIPAREMETSYEGNIDSDIYWSNLDSTFNEDEDYYWGEEGDAGFDFYAEIFIGRLTCDEPQDVSNWMTKSFLYADTNDMDILDNVALYGGNTGWSCQGDDFMDYSAYYGTDDYLGPIPGSSGPYPGWLGFQYGFRTWNNVNPSTTYELNEMWTAEPPNPNWQGGSESQAIAGLRDAISNDKATIISGIAHADANMALDVGRNSWESDYHNTKPFFLHDYGCHCGDMDAADDGVLHSMLFHSDTELAFGVVFNTCYGWGNFDSTNSSSAVQTKTFWDYFLDTANNSQTTTNWQLGKGHAWSKDVLAPTIDWEHTWRAILQGCLLFADPAQQLKSPNNPPIRPDPPTGPDNGVTGYEYAYSSSTTEPEGEDIYYMFDWGDGTASNWIGPYLSGQIAEASHTWQDPATYEVKVNTKDENGGQSGWSAPLMVEIIQAPVLELGVIQGGALRVESVLRNRGAVDASDITYTVTLDGGIILMGKETTGTISSLAPGDTAMVTSGLIFGFGKTRVIIEVEIPESYDFRDQGATILLFYVFVTPGGG
jgi:hypothetical protein